MSMFYSIGNGGDGSATVHFFDSKLASDQHQELENDYEGWAEHCAGEVDTPQTDAEWLAEMKQDLKDEESYHKGSSKSKLLKKFIKELEKKLK